VRPNLTKLYISTDAFTYKAQPMIGAYFRLKSSSFHQAHLHASIQRTSGFGAVVGHGA